MEKRHKDIMRTLVGKLRYILVGTQTDDGFTPGNLDRELERIGIAPNGTITPVDALANNVFNGELHAYRAALALLMPLTREQRVTARHEIIERAAYTWINRLLALRAMEVRDLIKSTLRGEEAYGGISEKLYFLRQDEPQRTSDADGGWWAVIEDACTAQAKALPGLFSLDDPNAALRPAPKALLQCIELVNGSQPLQVKGTTLADLDAVFADPDAIGWAYQFYQEEAKAAIDAKCKRGEKVASRAELAAKTQLFTEPYMVQWLLQNSLGRSYHEAYPQSALPANWDYYVMPETLDTPALLDLASLTLLDPCMGSGHFLRSAFDMFVAMYREQQPTLRAKEIADTILSLHLHGIDLDPRAAQLAALTLYLRAWELVREEQRKTHTFGDSSYIPPAMNLVTTPMGLTEGALERHLQRAPQDEIFKSLLKSIFAGLEHADILGSLLRPREYLDSAIADLLKPQNPELAFNPELTARRRDIIKLAKIDPSGLRNTLLETIANSFKIEAGNTSDVSVALFGREAEQGMRLLQTLDRRYAVVVTNPPYLGSRHMNYQLKKYVEKNYLSGKRDLYATFILRCTELCQSNGRVAMITMQGWMFLRSFANLRALSQLQLFEESKQKEFKGILRETSIEALSHLGRYAFSEIGNAVVAPLLIIFKFTKPSSKQLIWACRLTAPRPSDEQAALLMRTVQLGLLTGMCYVSRQSDFLSIPETPIVYWLGPHFIKQFQSSYTLKNIAEVRQGLATADNARFTRCFWEVSSLGKVEGHRPVSGRWFSCAKGGRYQKWAGLIWLCIDWQHNGERLRLFPKSVLRSPELYFKQGLTYTLMAQGCFATRLLDNAVFDGTGTSIFPTNTSVSRIHLAALTSTRIASYLLRVTTQDLKFSGGYVANLPLNQNLPLKLLYSIGQICIVIKQKLVSGDLVEHSFDKLLDRKLYTMQTVIHVLEGMNEKVVNDAYELDEQDIQVVLDETGTPAGWYPLIVGYDTLPTLPDNIETIPLPQELFDYLAEHKRIVVSDKELTRIKSNLKALYEAGPRAKGVEQEEGEETGEEGEEEMASGAHIPIPTETFLEELSVKMELHPISVYLLLEKLRAEGVRCKPEEKRLLEDHLSVLVLRLLGHRWPKQLETGEPVPTWADEHGIIPHVPGTGRATLAERVRERLQLEDGALETQKTEALLHELTGKTLEQWLRGNFFSKHIQQFKSRPIAWHLASTPISGETGTAKKKHGDTTERTTRGPAFECLLYYHACSRSALTRIRTQYVEPLLEAARDKVEQGGNTRFASNDGTQQETLLAIDEGAIPFAKLRIRELEDFVARLQQIEESGFDTPELRSLLMEESLDRWSGDGQQAPKNQDEFYRTEKAWHVDINDGVRVNIAPLQIAGVLTSTVLAKPTDAKKALTDRARWRADERRWVRAGKLPRCGWMDEQVQASAAWIEREESNVHTTVAQHSLMGRTGASEV
jgi:hypothetical protein